MTQALTAPNAVCLFDVGLREILGDLVGAMSVCLTSRLRMGSHHAATQKGTDDSTDDSTEGSTDDSRDDGPAPTLVSRPTPKTNPALSRPPVPHAPVGQAPVANDRPPAPPEPTDDDLASQPTFAPGTLLQNTYRICELLAVGGMGEVYVATHERLPGRFAVKVLSRTLAHDQDAYVRFCREAAVMSVLRHPNIVHVFDFNITPDGRPYLVMELLEGRDLGQHMRDGKPLPLRQVTRIVRQIASALAAAHSRGIVHRDLKPENVVLVPLEGQSEFVKILDFGISKARWSNKLTGDATVMGTPEYMAPEQAQGHREQIDARTDQFALAAMTYALLSGREPFTGDCSVTVLYQVVHEDPPPLAGLVTWPTEQVESVLRKGLAKQRTDRYPTVLDFARAFEQAVAAVMATTFGELDVESQYGMQDSRELPPAVCALATVRSLTPAAAKLSRARRKMRAQRRVSPWVMASAAALVVIVAAAVGVRWRWGVPANAAVEIDAPIGSDGDLAPRRGLRGAVSWAETHLGAPPPVLDRTIEAEPQVAPANQSSQSSEPSVPPAGSSPTVDQPAF